MQTLLTLYFYFSEMTIIGDESSNKPQKKKRIVSAKQTKTKKNQ